MVRAIRKIIAVIFLSQLTLTTVMAESCPPNGLVMGYTGWAPYQYNKESGDVGGLDIEIAQAIFKEINCPLITFERKWDILFKQIENGNIDLTAGASKSAEREKYAFYSDAYRSEQITLFVRTADKDKYQIKNITEIKNMNFVLGALKGAYLGEDFEKMKNSSEYQSHISLIREQSAYYKMLTINRIDGFIDDPFAVINDLKALGIQDKIVAYPLVVNTGDVYFVFSKQSVKEKFVEDFNAGLAAIKKTGAYESIIRKYYPK